MKKKSNNISVIFVLSLVISTLLGLISLDFTNIDFSLYFVNGDEGYFSMLTKSIVDYGILGLWSNPSLGGISGCTLAEFPNFDLVSAFVIWMISVFTNHASIVCYIFLLLTFTLTDCTMFFLLNRLGIDSGINFVFSVLYSIAPYHFCRYFAHINLSAYYCVPLGIYLLLYSICTPIDAKTNNTCSKNNVLLNTLIGIIIGMSQLYYAFFISSLFIIGLLYCIAIGIKHFKVVIFYFSTILFGVSLQLIPTIIFRIQNGTNTVIAKHLFYEQEIYGLKIIQLMLPNIAISRRLPFFAHISDVYNASGILINENSSAALGFWGIIGFCIILFYAFCSITEKKIAFINRFSALCVVFLILLSCIGGFGELFNILISSQFRCYNRTSIIILCFCFIVLSNLINSINSKSIIVALNILILCIGVFDQLYVYEHWQDSTIISQKSDQEFFSKLQNKLNSGTMIYQLPYMELLTGLPCENLQPYGHFKGYLNTHDIKWSFGCFIGRNEAEKNLYIDDGMSQEFVDKIISVGYEGVYIDLNGYGDNSLDIINYYLQYDPDPIISDDRMLYYFDIQTMNH